MIKFFFFLKYVIIFIGDEMKGKFLLSILLIAICVFLVGCGKKEAEPIIDGGWEVDLLNERTIVEDDAIVAFKKANNKNYKLLALLGKQIVAGTNYMFFVKENSSYKVIVVYSDLDNNAKVTSTTDFDITKYVNENISYKNEDVVGGWYTDIPSKAVMLDEDVQSALDQAVNNLDEIDYMPIGVIGHQVVAGTNYAILAYGRVNDDEANDGVYLLTLYKDLEGNGKLVSSAYIDLADFNK